MSEADLSVRLTLIDNFTNQLKEVNNNVHASATQMQSDFGALTGALQTVGVSMAAFGAAITGALGLTVKSLVDTGTQLTELSEETGLSTQALSEWGYIAEQNGSSLSSLANHIMMLDRSISDVSGSSGTAQKAITQIGLTLSQLQSENPQQQFEDVATALMGIPDPTQRAADTLAIFGRGGADLIPILAQGKQGIADLKTEAGKLGIVMDPEQAAAAKKFSDALDNVKESFKGLQYAIAPFITNVLQPLIENITNVVTNITNWSKAHPDLAKTITDVAGALGVALTVLGTLIATVKIATTVWTAFNAVFITSPIGAVLFAIGALIAIGIELVLHWQQVKIGLAESWDTIKEIFAQSVKAIYDSSIRPLLNGIAALMDGIANVIGVVDGKWANSIRNAANEVRGFAKDIDNWSLSVVNGALNDINALDDESAALQKKTAALNQDIPAINADTGALNTNTGAINANVAAQQKAITSLTSMGGSGSSGGSSGGTGGTMADWNLRSAQLLYNAWYTSQKITPSWQQQQDAWADAQKAAAAANASGTLPVAFGQQSNLGMSPVGTIWNPRGGINDIRNQISTAGSTIMGAVTGGTSTATSPASGSGSNFVIPQTGNTSVNLNGAPLTTTINNVITLDGKPIATFVNKTIGQALSQRGNMP